MPYIVRNVSLELTPSRQLARRLIDADRGKADSSSDRALFAAVAFDQLYQELARWVGFDGCHALFTRALAQARDEHPLLDTIQLYARSSPYLLGVTETVARHGSVKTAEALEAILVILIEVLGRLIGEEMTTNLIELGFAESTKDEADGASRRAEA
jgi:hypothetical protein